MEWRKICDHNLTTKILKEPILTPFSPCIWQEKWRKIKENAMCRLPQQSVRRIE